MRISDWSSDVCSSDRGFDAEFGKQGCQECGSQRLLFIVVSIGREEIASRPAFLVLDHHEAGSVMAFRHDVGTGIAGARKSVVSGKSVSVRVDLGGRRSIKKKKTSIRMCITCTEEIF